MKRSTVLLLAAVFAVGALAGYSVTRPGGDDVRTNGVVWV